MRLKVEMTLNAATAQRFKETAERLTNMSLGEDGLIAATAIIFNYPFITKNQRDYRFIQNLNLLPYP